MYDIYDYKNLVSNVVFGNRFVVYHAFARYYNFGDNALAYGVKNIFQKYFFDEICWINKDVHTTIFDNDNIDRINNIGNLFIVGGGGLIHTLNEFWMFNIDKEAMKNLRTPLLVYGLGFNNFSNQIIDDRAKNNIVSVAEKSFSFSVRNDGSSERLSEYGMNFDVVPDPGFFVDGNHPKPDIDGEYVVVQVAYDAPLDRIKNTDTFFQNMIVVCQNLIDRGYKIIFAPHCLSDISACKFITNNFDNDCYIWDWFKCIREDNVCTGLGYYKYAKFVLAMRGHAQICPIGMTVPVISIINHPKHMGLLEKINQEKLMVMVDDVNFVEKVIALIECVENNYTIIKTEYRAIIDKLTEETRSYIFNLKQRYFMLNYFNKTSKDLYKKNMTGEYK